MRKRQIPLHLPQAFPFEWSQSLTSADAIPTEEQLTPNSLGISDDIYNGTLVKMDSRAVVYAAMHAFSSPDIPGIKYVGGNGSFNKVFCLEFSDGFRVAARIARPQHRTLGLIASVAATMTMARFYANLPAPEVYAWHASDDNPVGAPYMLLEWADGIDPSAKWEFLSSENRILLLDELATYHAKFAKPLPFQGLGSIYFADAPSNARILFNDASAYRLGPLLRGPTCMVDRRISSWPQTIPTSLRDFWLELWEHEVNSITDMFGSDRSAIIAEEDLSFFSYQEECTLGQFLDLSEHVLSLIQACPLPPQSQPELYDLCFASTDYAFRNIKMDSDTHRITAFLDWDDVYVMPFLLCSQYPEDICHYSNAGESWRETGAFKFLPPEEEGEIEEDFFQEAPEAPLAEGNPDDGDEDEDGVSSEGTSDDHDVSVGALESDEDESESERESFSDLDIPEYDRDEDSRIRRIKDTRLRRQYEGLLSTYDPRFGLNGFWEMRKDPLKIQHLMLRGWTEWLRKRNWIKNYAEELKP